MEYGQPRTYGFDPNSEAARANSLRSSKGSEFSRRTGHISLESTQKNPKKVRAPEAVITAGLAQNVAVEHRRSSWHSYDVDNGNVVNQDQMGEAFQRELQPEQMMQGSASVGQVAFAMYGNGQQQVPAHPIKPTNYTVAAQQPGPQVVASSPPVQPVTQQFLGSQPAMPQFTAQPQFQALPQAPVDPALASGVVDSQHLLPARKSLFARVIQSPWLWLCIGLAMIAYFAFM